MLNQTLEVICIKANFLSQNPSEYPQKKQKKSNPYTKRKKHSIKRTSMIIILFS